MVLSNIMRRMIHHVLYIFMLNLHGFGVFHVNKNVIDELINHLIGCMSIPALSYWRPIITTEIHSDI